MNLCTSVPADDGFSDASVSLFWGSAAALNVANVSVPSPGRRSNNIGFYQLRALNLQSSCEGSAGRFWEGLNHLKAPHDWRSPQEWTRINTPSPGLFLRSQFVWICLHRARLVLVRAARALPASSQTWCGRNTNNRGTEFMCTCEHIEVIRQVTSVLKSGKVPELELIPPQLDGQWLGRSWRRRGGGEPGAALVTNTWWIRCVSGATAGTGAGTSSVSELVLFPEMIFVVWMRKMSEIL